MKRMVSVAVLRKGFSDSDVQNGVFADLADLTKDFSACAQIWNLTSAEHTALQVVLDQKDGVFAVLREGSYLGESCVLGLSTLRPLSVRAASWCNLFCLTEQALEDCICSHRKSPSLE